MKNYFGKYFLFLSLFLAPNFVFAGVKINEIAWMGTEKSSYGEWIELYNDSETEIDLSGASLYEEGGKVLIIKLTKKISPKSYYLIERVTPSNPDPIPELADDMGSFGGSGLKNLPGGEYLVLKASDGSVLDSIDASAGWPAGDSDTKLAVKTMQLQGNLWITATATPKALNSTIDGSDKKEESNKGTASDVEEAASYSSHSSSAELSKTFEKIKVSLVSGRDRVVLSGAPVYFLGKFVNESGANINDGNFSWSFGDGGYSTGHQVSHIYDIQGEYVVVLNANYSGDEYVGRSNIKVVEPNFELTTRDGVVYIKNKLQYEVNLKNWKIQDGNRYFIFQSDTIVLAGKEVPFSSKLLGFDIRNSNNIELVSPAGKVCSVTRSNMNLATVDKVGDKIVEKGVDNLGNNQFKIDLSTLEQKLKELQETLNFSFPTTSKIALNIENKAELEYLSVKKPEIKNTKTDRSSSTKEVIVLEPLKREFFVWGFLKNLLYR